MKQFDCPHIGRRPASEFLCAGGMIGVLQMQDPAAARRALYFGDATARVKCEWWLHRPSRLWFRFERDTATDQVVSIELANPEYIDAPA
jgi:sarcosine oxidase, subunit delta